MSASFHGVGCEVNLLLFLGDLPISSCWLVGGDESLHPFILCLASLFFSLPTSGECCALALSLSVCFHEAESSEAEPRYMICFEFPLQKTTCLFLWIDNL